jgi:hypothetical protein
MGIKSEGFKAVALEDSIWAVVRSDPDNPRFIEVIATFYDEARARDYAISVTGPSNPQEPAPPPPAREVAKSDAGAAELSQRQSAVLAALKAQMDDNNQVAVKAAVLAEAAQIPLGSLHSVLGSLEKKNLIQTSRPGSARAPAIYQVL